MYLLNNPSVPLTRHEQILRIIRIVIVQILSLVVIIGAAAALLYILNHDLFGGDVSSTVESDILYSHVLIIRSSIIRFI